MAANRKGRDFVVACQAGRAAWVRAVDAGCKPAELAMLGAVIQELTLYSWTEQRVSLARLARLAGIWREGTIEDDVPHWATRRVSERLRALAEAKVLTFQPGRPGGVRSVIGLPRDAMVEAADSAPLEGATVAPLEGADSAPLNGGQGSNHRSRKGAVAARVREQPQVAQGSSGCSLPGDTPVITGEYLRGDAASRAAALERAAPTASPSVRARVVRILGAIEERHPRDRDLFDELVDELAVELAEARSFGDPADEALESWANARFGFEDATTT